MYVSMPLCRDVRVGRFSSVNRRVSDHKCFALSAIVSSRYVTCTAMLGSLYFYKYLSSDPYTVYYHDAKRFHASSTSLVDHSAQLLMPWPFLGSLILQLHLPLRLSLFLSNHGCLCVGFHKSRAHEP